MKINEIMQFNCNGVRAQFNEIKELIIKYNPSVILLQELKVKKGDKVTFRGYNFITKLMNEDSSAYPSIGILIKVGIKYDIINTPTEWCVLGVNILIKKQISLYSYYDNHRMQKLSKDQLEQIVKMGKFNAIVMGDFNAHSLLWDKEITGSRNANCNRGKSILEFIKNSDYTILNDGRITRISNVYGERNSALDLAIVHKEFTFSFNWSVEDNIYGSDHLPTFLSTQQNNSSKHEGTIFDLNSTNWDIFNEVVEFSEETLAFDVDQLDEKLSLQIEKALKASTKAFVYPNNKKRNPCWFDGEVDKARKAKNKALKVFINLKTRESMIEMKRTGAVYRRLSNEKRIASWSNYVEEMNSELGTRELWMRLRKVKGQDYSRDILQIMDDKNSLTDDPVKISNILAKFYANISSKSRLKDEDRLRLEALENNDDGCFENEFITIDQEFSMDEFLAALQLTKDSAPGPDGVKYKVYKKTRPSFLQKVLNLFNIVWTTGKRPKSWKMSNVIPFPKSNCPTEPNKTRPINLINTMPKLFDKMVNRRLIFCLESKRALSKMQFGFRENKQTLGSMVVLDSYVHNALNNKKHVQLISFDIKKAFDSVWPIIILKKLRELNIGGKLYNYIKDFLEKRNFFVTNNGVRSEVVETDIGVPQGSPLSSTLFLIAFQSLLDCLDVESNTIKYSAYADDLVIYADELSNKKSRKIMQKTVNKLISRANEIGLEFSGEKTKTIHICRKRNCTSEHLYLGNDRIEQVTELRLLGLTIQRNYKFDTHIEILKTKLTRDLNLLKILSNVKFSIEQDTMRRIIIALVVSKIRYCIEIYGIAKKESVKKLDVMLNHFRRLMLKSFCSTPVDTLKVQSGIMCFQEIRNKAVMSHYVNMESLNEVDQDSFSGLYSSLEEYMEHLGLFENEGSRMDYTEVKKELLFISPLKNIKTQIHLNIFKKKKEDLDPRESRLIFKDFVEKGKYKSIYYTDGSKIDESVTYAVVKNERMRGGKVHCQSSVFTAEATAILNAVHMIKSDTLSLKSLIASDSLSVLSEIKAIGFKKSTIAKKIINELTSNIDLVWIPGHFGIPGNEEADKYANEIHYDLDMMDRTCNKITAEDYRKVVRRSVYKDRKDEWLKLCSETENKFAKIYKEIEYLPSWKISKKDQMIVNRIRAGHSFLTHSYLITKSAIPLCQFCDEDISIEHMFECTNMGQAAYISNLSWKEDIFIYDKWKNIKKFLMSNDFYNQI